MSVFYIRIAQATRLRHTLHLSLVHGSLTHSLVLQVIFAQLLEGLTVKPIVYRNHAPLYVDEAMRVCVRKLDAKGK